MLRKPWWQNSKRCWRWRNVALKKMGVSLKTYGSNRHEDFISPPQREKWEFFFTVHFSSKQNLGAINSLPTKHVDFTKKDRTIVSSLKSENPRCCLPVFFRINCKKNNKTKRILKHTPSSNIWKAH